MSQSSIDFTENGPVVPDTATVRDAVETDWQAAFDNRMNPDPATPQGQLITSETAIVQDKNSQLLFLANMFNPETAEGIYQDALAKIYFLTRQPARSTVVPCTCTGLPGTVIPGIGSEAPALAKDADGNILVCQSGGTIPQSGSIVLDFACQVPGPIEIRQGTVTTIVRTIPGWDTITNADGIIGQNVESRAAFEARRYASVAKNARSVAAAVYANVGDLDGVLDVCVRENKTSAPLEVQGVTLNPHSIYVAVIGSAADSDIAEAIYARCSAGCDYNGNTSVTVTDPVTGAVETVLFERPESLPVGIHVTIRKNASMPSNVEELIKAAVVAEFYGETADACENTGQRVHIGDTVYASRFYSAVLGTGVTDLVSIEIAAPVGEGSPTWGDYITINIDEAPTLISDNVTVTILEVRSGRG